MLLQLGTVLGRHQQRQGVGDDADLGRQVAGEFAIDLQADALIPRLRRRYAPGAQHDDAPHALDTIGDETSEIPHIAQGGAALEQDELEMVVEQADVAGDLEIAAVVADFADQGKRTAVRHAIGLNRELRQPAPQHAPAGQPVCQLADARLQRCTDLVDDLGVQADARHQQKMPGGGAGLRIHLPDRNTLWAAFAQAARGTQEIAAEFHLHRQHVGGARRQHSQRHLGMRHAFGHFVEGAVAAGGQNQIRAARDLFPRQRARGAWTGGGAARHLMPVLFQDCGGARDQRASFPPQLARAWVINEDGLAVAGDSGLSRFLVRL